MRTAAVGLVLAAFAGTVFAQPEPYTSSDGKFTATFPGTPKVTVQTAKSAVGSLKVHVATYANADGSVFMVSYTDFPAAATKPDNHETLFEGIRDGVKGKDGKLVGDEKSVEFGPSNLPSREFTVDKDKAKQRIQFRVVIQNTRVYQVAAIGSPEFASGKEANAFFSSFNLTK